jgi:DNA-binding transcriptional regulator YdaS (Cro superfamily)
MAKPSPIATYRKNEGLTLEAFASLVGKSKGHMHEVETTMKCSAKLALEIERATGGEVNAALLNDEIAQARQMAA